MTPTRVKAIRRALGLTQKQLAARLGVHLVTVKKWETGAYSVGRQAAVRLWLLERATTPGDVAGARELVEALSRPDAGGVLGVARPGQDRTGSVTVAGRERRFTRVDCPGRVPSVVFAFEDLDADELEPVRLALLERALESASAAQAELGEVPRPRRRRGGVDAWVRPDWLRRNGSASR